MQTWPKISVVIPIRNEAAFIEQTITAIVQQDYPKDRLEVLVVDGDSDDGTPQIVEGIASRSSGLRLLHNPRRLASRARNIGIKHATGDIVLFVDGHVHIDNDRLLRSVATLMDEKGVSVLSRPQFLEPPDNTSFQNAVAAVRRSFLGHGTDSTIYTRDEKYVDPSSSGAAYKREVFEKVGLFDEKFDASEDYEFNYRVARAGFRSYTSPLLTVFYYPRRSLGSLFRQMTRYGTGRMRLARKHPKTLGAGTLVPPLFTAGLPAAVVSTAVWPPLWLPWTVIYGFYALLVTGVSAGIALRHGLRLFFSSLFVFPVVHAGLGWGFIAEGWRGLLKPSPASPSDE